MSETINNTSLPFGRLRGQEIRLMEFCPDPDGSNLIWYRFTDETMSLNGLRIISDATRHNSGGCFDTGEYYSYVGELLREILSVAPAESVAASFTTDGWCGTRTFSESVTALFYGQSLTETDPGA